MFSWKFSKTSKPFFMQTTPSKLPDISYSSYPLLPRVYITIRAVINPENKFGHVIGSGSVKHEDSQSVLSSQVNT